MTNSKQKAAYAVANINHNDLVIVEMNGRKFIPITPICAILGVDAKAQRNRIQRDPILGSTGVITTSVGADQKDREMYCLPLEFVFGWLFTINADLVSPDAREAVIRYKLECYEALYSYFTLHSRFVEYHQKIVEEQLEVVERINEQFRTAKTRLRDAKEELKRRRSFSMDDFLEIPESVETLQLVLEQA